MRKSRFTETQIVAILNAHDAGSPTAERAREHGVHPNTLRLWRAKYGGMDVSDVAKVLSLRFQLPDLVPGKKFKLLSAKPTIATFCPLWLANGTAISGSIGLASAAPSKYFAEITAPVVSLKPQLLISVAFRNLGSASTPVVIIPG